MEIQSQDKFLPNNETLKTRIKTNPCKSKERGKINNFERHTNIVQRPETI